MYDVLKYTKYTGTIYNIKYKCSILRYSKNREGKGTGTTKRKTRLFDFDTPRFGHFDKNNETLDPVDIHPSVQIYNPRTSPMN